jgi:hypothetical protein
MHQRTIYPVQKSPLITFWPESASDIILSRICFLIWTFQLNHIKNVKKLPITDAQTAWLKNIQNFYEIKIDENMIELFVGQKFLYQN